MTGEGQQVQTSLLEAQVAMPSYQAFRARDGWVVVGAFTERMWQGVCRALDRPYPAEDPRFRTNHDRLAHRAEILGLLERCFAEEPAAHWIARMAAESVPCAPVHTVGKVVADAQVRARDMVVDVPHGAVEGLRLAGLPIKLGATPGAIRRQGCSRCDFCGRMGSFRVRPTWL